MIGTAGLEIKDLAKIPRAEYHNLEHHPASFVPALKIAFSATPRFFREPVTLNQKACGDSIYDFEYSR